MEINIAVEFLKIQNSNVQRLLITSRYSPAVSRALKSTAKVNTASDGQPDVIFMQTAS